MHGGRAALTALTKCRQVEMLEQSVEQLKASLELEKRSNAANHRRLVAENAGLLRQLRETQRDADSALPSMRANPSCCAGRSQDNGEAVNELEAGRTGSACAANSDEGVGSNKRPGSGVTSARCGGGVASPAIRPSSRSTVGSRASRASSRSARGT